ncbi:hypothetical protein [Thiomicrorhabdus sediminis]|uniref:MetA-pathway of phenol degradation n=1 Tax=Thiomicrorhabdus sediminis TaxID=2580412 RepID=A0A4P9K4D2_9GAMM|nr:hypothetical protein [Thiomicrorhabdus sediminis]QCU89789.1 hypothetical protein FE785_03615 [Thiomicrorhabdus sediminis]
MNKKLSALVLATAGVLASTGNASAAQFELSDDQKRLIAALLTAPKSAPGIGIGVPTGFAASSGQMYFSVGGTTTINNKLDGSASVGAGFGDTEKLAMELQLNIISLTNNGQDSGFGEQGSGSIKFSHNVGKTSGVSFGAENIARWGAGLEQVDPSVYLAYTNVQPLSSNPFNPYTLSLTVGVGNERFANVNNGTKDSEIGIFGAAALAVHRQVGLILDYNGNYVSGGLSFVPMKEYPLTVTLSAVNVNGVDAADGGTATGKTEFGGSIGYSFSW